MRGALRHVSLASAAGRLPGGRHLQRLQRERGEGPARALRALSDVPETLKPQAAPGTWECALQQLPPAGRVLSAGAGRGGLSWLLHQAGYEVVSIDLHPEHFVADGLRCDFAELTAPLPFEGETFDAVLAVEVAEHLENPWSFLREGLRVLRPHGKLVFTSPNVGNLASRLLFLRSGVFPYFREESFVGCYHVTPVFHWSVERWTRTTSSRLRAVTYTRVDWPTPPDVPKFHGGLLRIAKNLVPLNALTGEIACYTIERCGQPSVAVGTHYA